MKNINYEVVKEVKSIISEFNLFDLASANERDVLYNRPYYLQDFTTNQRTTQQTILALYILTYTSDSNEMHSHPDVLVSEIYKRVVADVTRYKPPVNAFRLPVTSARLTTLKRA